MGSVKSEGLDRKEFGLRLLGLRHMLLSSCVETCHFPTDHVCPLPAPPSPALMSNLTTHVTDIKEGHCPPLRLPAVTMVALHSCPQENLPPQPLPWELLLILGPQQGTMMRSPVSRVSQLSQAHHSVVGWSHSVVDWRGTRL